MTSLSATSSPRFRRSLLSVPAINARALQKSLALACDGVIFDLEDSVALERKAEARRQLAAFLSQRPANAQEAILRINGCGSADFAEDIALAISCRPDAVLLPKAERLSDLVALRAALPPDLPIWAMIETPRAVLDIATLADGGRSQGLAGLVVGLNDLRKLTRVPASADRAALVPWLTQVVLAARANGLAVIDSVCNEFHRLDAVEAECRQGRALGFDGKMLIHPAQIDPANRAFGPTQAEIDEARRLVALFAAPENAERNVINHAGQMVERLHAEQAAQLLAQLALAGS